MQKNISLANRAISAVFWGGFGSITQALLQIVTQIILARLLGPTEYGLFAIAMIVLSFSTFFSDIGIAYGLIQKKTISNDDIKFVFTWQLILGTVVAVTLFFLAEILASFFKEQRVFLVIQVISIICLISAVSAPSLNLLKRNLDFKSIQMAQLLSYFCGYFLVGIPLAWAGQKVWALVAAFIITSLINLAILYRQIRHPIGIHFWNNDDNHLIIYGIRVFATNLINWIISNIDRVIIGRIYPPAEIGLYALSYNLVSNPAGSSINVIQSALFSTSARVQDDFERLHRAFLTMVATVTLFAFPVFVGIAAVPETIVQSLYGNSWLGAAQLLRPIALAMPMYVLLGIATPLLWVSGHTQKEFLIQIPIAIGFALTAYFAALNSLVAVAWVVFGMYFIRSITILVVTCYALKIGLIKVFRTMTGGIIITIVTTLAIIITDFSIKNIIDIPVIWLLFDVMSGALSILIMLWFFPKFLDPHIAQLFEKIALRLPYPAAGWLQKFIYRSEFQ